MENLKAHSNARTSITEMSKMSTLISPRCGSSLVRLRISNVETALNSVWGVHRSRNWARRFPDYLAMLTLAPLLFGAALALPAALQSQWIVQQVLEVSGFAALFSAGLRHASLVLSIFAIA